MRKIGLLFFICVFCAGAVWCATPKGEIDYVAPDGRFTVSGDYSKDCYRGDKVVILRGERRVGTGIVTIIKPDYMELKTQSLERDEWVMVGDRIERISAGAGGPAAASANLEPAVVSVLEAGGRILTYGDHAERGFRPGNLVEIVRGGTVVGAAEVVEVGAHITILKLIGTSGGEVMKGDTLQIPHEAPPSAEGGPLQRRSAPKRLLEKRTPVTEGETVSGGEEEEREEPAETKEAGKPKGKTPIEKRINERR
ncbi:MAG: hypothetical protein AB1546_16525 [bacterium]